MAIRLLVSSLLLTGSVHSYRVAKSGGTSFDAIACPVMASLVKHGVITLDSDGLASQEATIRGLMWTGNSRYMATFQAKGIVAFKKTDVHGEVREKAGNIESSDLYLNYYTWNPYSKCVDGKGPVVAVNGVAKSMKCNANIGFQNHGYSTTIRDPTDGSLARDRFEYWMGLPGVLVNHTNVSGKVMTLAGLGALLKEVSLKGDKSGEFALNADNEIEGSPLQFYHPSVNTRRKQKGSSQWQAVVAWGSFMALFGTKDSSGEYYISERDLRSLFLGANLPEDFEPFEWGWRETVEVMVGMKGTGAGEVWVEEMEKVLGYCSMHGLSEECFYQGMVGALVGLGTQDDAVFKTYS